MGQYQARAPVDDTKYHKREGDEKSKMPIKST